MRAHHYRLAVAALAALALALRCVGIAAQPLQWDEGWTIALARLPLADALRLTALDVHPPLYYALAKYWLAAVGASPLGARSLSALVGAAGVPLAAAAAWRWAAVLRPDGGPAARRTAGAVAALAIAVAPPLVYYGGIARMYALATTVVLAAAWGVARAAGGRGATTAAGGRGRARAAGASLGLGAATAVVGAAGALLSFYYAGFALAGLGAAAIVARPSAWRRALAWGGGTAALAAPWLAYAGPRLAARMADRSAAGGAATEAAAGAAAGATAGGGGAGAALDAIAAAASSALGGWRAVLFVNAGSTALAVIVAVALVVGLARRPGRGEGHGQGRGEGRAVWGALALVWAPIALVVAAGVAGARAHMFAPRYVSVATPFVGLGLALAAATTGRRRIAVAAAAVGLAAASWPTLSGAIFARSAELFDPYDPSEVHDAVRALARPGDVVAFNILSQAGAYESARGPRSPAWTYAQLWDPVHEPVKLAVARVETAYEAALRGERGTPPGTAALWLALYRGTAAADTAALKAWADDELFPTAGRWLSDTLLVGYVDAPTDASRDFAPPAVLGDGIVLRRARFSARAVPGGHVALTLRWRADAAPAQDARVVVRLVDPADRTVAQRDAVPVHASRPTTTWQPGESLDDRHGLRLPDGVAGPLRLVVGFVDAGGAAIGPAVEVGQVEVGGEGAGR